MHEITKVPGETVGHVLVPSPVRFMDRSLPTASWYDLHEAVPGMYLIVRDSRPGMEYCVAARIDTLLVAEYRENRLLSEVRANLKQHEPPEPAVYWWHSYDYEINGKANQHGWRIIPTTKWASQRAFQELERQQRQQELAAKIQ